MPFDPIVEVFLFLCATLALNLEPSSLFPRSR